MPLATTAEGRSLVCAGDYCNWNLERCTAKENLNGRHPRRGMDLSIIRERKSFCEEIPVFLLYIKKRLREDRMVLLNRWLVCDGEVALHY